MIRTIALAALLAFAVPAGSQSTLPPIPVYVTCSVPTLGRPSQCIVEFWGMMSGISIGPLSRPEAEELVAILIEHSGRSYVYETGLIPANGGTAQRKPRERFGRGDAK